MQRAFLTGLMISIVVACGGPASRSEGGSVVIDLRGPEAVGQARAEMEPFEAAFASLEAALNERQDALARRILDRILAREPRGAALERARRMERTLEGREWMAALEIRLVAKRLGESDEWRVQAFARHGHATALTLRGAPPMLRTALIGVAPDGMEQRFAQQDVIPDLAEWKLPPGKESRADLGKFTIPIGNAMAVRALFQLDLMPVEILLAGQSRPASAPPPARTEAVRLAPFLPTAAIDAAELVRYVRDAQIRPAPLLERTVRIPWEQRAAALDRLTPAALELPPGELEKLAVALRWLSGNADLGADPHRWRQWLNERAKRRAAGDAAAGGSSVEPAASALELPDDLP